MQNGMQQEYEVVVIGGGPAGLNAGLILGRSRRRVLICDGGRPRNAPAPAAHNLLTRDGTPPLEILAIGRAQLEPYPSVEFAPVEVTTAVRRETAFVLELSDGRTVISNRVLFAGGLRDELPDIPGLNELWGKSIAACPYCHGWEVRDLPLAIFGNGSMGFDLARLLTGWSRDLVLCTHGPSTLSPEEDAQLKANGIAIREEPIIRLEGKDGVLEAVVFASGEPLLRRAGFMRPPFKLAGLLPEQLGCTFDAMGLIEVDAMGKTSVPGLYAAGDATTRMQSITMAVATGAAAAAMINHELIHEAFDRRTEQGALPSVQEA